ncbi:MAG: DHHW family protein [Oscillospiraceae bacterium]|nr:DHHW family protein [Oscillospiraceae bacterium]
MEKARNKLTIIVFAALLLVLGVAFFIMPNNHRSQAERRLLARPPQLTAQRVFSGEFARDFEVYMQDQFPAREQFRTINALTRHYGMRQRDHNGYYFVAGHLSQMEFPLNPQAVHNNAAWLAGLSRQFFEDMNVYYAIFPDKNYFLAPPHGFLSLDYDAMLRLIHRQMGQHTFIDLFDVMSLDDFYRTDIHWRQEEIFPVAARLANTMGVTLPAQDSFTAHRLYPFYGSFHGHAALPVPPDELIFLTNDYTENAIVYVLDNQLQWQRSAVYTTELFGEMDSYDVFLAGAQALITIEVLNAQTNRELIIFRDSFGSSIAPLLLGAYSRVTLVDIRYIPSRLLPQFIDFDGQDVLFLFSTVLMNRPDLFR